MRIVYILEHTSRDANSTPTTSKDDGLPLTHRSRGGGGTRYTFVGVELGTQVTHIYCKCNTTIVSVASGCTVRCSKIV